MTMQLKTTTILCAAVLGLAACSSSGSGSNNGNSAASVFGKPVNTATATPSQTTNNTTNTSNSTSGGKTFGIFGKGNQTGSNTSTPTASNTQNNNTAPQTPAANNNTGSYNGKILVTQGQNGANAPVADLSSNSKDVININGNPVTIKNSVISSRTFNRLDAGANTTIASDRALSHMRFGVSTQFSGADSTSSAFTVGSITPAAQVPTTGTAKYEGLAATSIIGGGAWDTGTSSFDVNFGNKSITGTVSHSGMGELPLSATINGASFTGTHNGITTNGNFFGPNAAEMGGVFNGTVINNGSLTNYMGSFGASKK